MAVRVEMTAASIIQQTVMLLLTSLLLIQLLSESAQVHADRGSNFRTRGYFSYRRSYYHSYSSFPIGSIIGMVIAALFFLGFVIAGLVFCCCFLRAVNSRQGGQAARGRVLTQPAVTVTQGCPYPVANPEPAGYDPTKGPVPPPYSSAVAATADPNGGYIGPAAAGDAQPPPYPTSPNPNPNYPQSGVVVGQPYQQF